MPKVSSKKNVPPVETVRLGGIAAKIYANKVENSPIPLYKITFDRTYTVQGEFKTVTSFRQEDLPYLLHVSNEAWLRVEKLKAAQWEDSRKESNSTDDESDEENE